MKRVTALFGEKEAANSVAEELNQMDMGDSSLEQLGTTYQQRLMESSILLPRERWAIWIGALVGASALGSLFLVLAQMTDAAVLLGRLLAGGLGTVALTGAGVGAAAGGLLGGLHAMSAPLPRRLKGQWLLVVYPNAPGDRERVLRLVRSHDGNLL